MKEKITYAFLVLFLIALTGGAPALYAEEDSSEASDQAQEVSASGGGESSALNEDLGQNSGSKTPDVAEVFSQDDNGGSDPSAFEGDTDSMPGEKAPENLPMDDAPVDAGIGVE